MKNSKIFNLEGYGDITLRKRKRVRNLVLSGEPGGSLRVTIPYWMTFSDARNMISSNLEWVNRYLQRMAKVKEKHEGLKGDHDFIIDLEEATNKLTCRLWEIARKHNFSFNKVKVRVMKSRWGSCSSKNDISLNAKLTGLPDRFINYVLLHELVHTKVKNHSVNFWFALNAHLHEAKRIDKELRQYHPGFI